MIWEICSNLYITFQELIGSFYLLNKYESECEDGETSVAQILRSESKSLAHESSKEPATCRDCNWGENGVDVTCWIQIKKDSYQHQNEKNCTILSTKMTPCLKSRQIGYDLTPSRPL